MTSIKRNTRFSLKNVQCVVIKIGSRTLASKPEFYDALAEDLARLKARGVRVVLVSSGAIALGTKKLAYKSRPTEMAKLQAAAAAGQSLLMRAYEEAFSKRGMTVAQVLLTHADLADRLRANNARSALSALLDAGCIPILNENDSVAVDEIKFGDNDQLSALVVPLVDADALFLLSDIPGVLNHEEERISVVHDIQTEAIPYIKTGKKAKNAQGTGGMESKIEAARRAVLFGSYTLIANALEQNIASRVLAGEDLGTLFMPASKLLSAKKHWIAFTLRPKGDLLLDDGCVEAITRKGKSILAIGVLGVRGDFREGDSIRLLDRNKKEIGRGLARWSASESAKMAWEQEIGREQLSLSKTQTTEKLLVHRDEMIIWPETQK